MAQLLESDDPPKVGKSARTNLPKGEKTGHGASPKGRGKAQSSLIQTTVLTAKQDKFASFLAFGTMSLTDAYKASYDTEGMTDKSVNEAASRLAKNNKIVSRVHSLKAVHLNVVSQDMSKMRALALDTLATEAQGIGPDTKSSSRISAAVAIGKIRDIDLFADHKVVEHRDDSRVDALKSKLVQWLERHAVTDATALPRQIGQETSVLGPPDPPTGGDPP